MFKTIFILLLTVFTTAYASQSSRVDTMQGLEISHSSSLSQSSSVFLGRAGFYDPSDILIFPHLSNKYSDFVNIYYGGGNNYGGFGTFEMMKGLTLGIADFSVVKTLDGLENVNLNDFQGNDVQPLSTHKYSAFLAYGLSNMSFGLSFNYWGFKHRLIQNTQDTTNNKINTASRTADSGIYSFNASFGMKINDIMGFDAMIKTDFGTFTNEVYDTTANPKTKIITSPESYLMLSIGGRYFLDLTSRLKITAWLFFDYNKQEYKDIDYTTEEKKYDKNSHLNSGKTTNIGISFDINSFNNKVKVKPQIGFLFISNNLEKESLSVPDKGSKTKAETSLNMLPYIGISSEYEIKKWLTIYTGYSKIITTNNIKLYNLAKNNGDTTANTSQEYESSNKFSNFSIGLSLQNEDLKFIATMNKNLIINGPNFISGTNTPMFLNATIQYSFGAPAQKLKPQSTENFTPVKKQEVKKLEKVTENPVKKEEENLNYTDDTETTDDTEIDEDIE